MLEVTRRRIACWNLEEEGYRVGSYMKNDSVLEVTRRMIACWNFRKRMKACWKLPEEG